MAQLLGEAELADQLGLEVFAIGEHHRRDYLVSSPAVVLAAIAAGTERIRAVSHADVMRSIELFGTEVAPAVRAEVARKTATAPGPEVASRT